MKKIICLCLTVLMAFATATVTMAETPSQKVARLQQELNAIKDQIAANEADISKQQQVRNSYVAQKNTLLAQIEALNLSISETETSLAIKQEELAAKVLEVERQIDLFEQRLVAQYTTKNSDDVSVIMGASSWGGILRYQENLQSIAVSDTNLITNLRTQQAELEAQKAEFEAQILDLQNQNAELEAKTAELQSAIVQANSNITSAEAELEAQNAAYGDKYDDLQRANQEMQAWLTSNYQNYKYEGGGQFGWPVPGVYRISSDFGWRTLYGKADYHRGIDIAASAGTPIVAAESGYVSTTAHWSYGTCVKIDHGSQLISLYGHMLSRASGITDGVWVNKGDLIGYVGSTGQSTGNHLHFEINQSGQVINPWGYLNA